MFPSSWREKRVVAHVWTVFFVSILREHFFRRYPSKVNMCKCIKNGTLTIESEAGKWNRIDLFCVWRPQIWTIERCLDGPTEKQQNRKTNLWTYTQKEIFASFSLSLSRIFAYLFVVCLSSWPMHHAHVRDIFFSSLQSKQSGIGNRENIIQSFFFLCVWASFSFGWTNNRLKSKFQIQTRQNWIEIFRENRSTVSPRQS